MDKTGFRLTYATMFDPPEILHTRFEETLARVRSELGKEYGMIIGAEERFTGEKLRETSPAAVDTLLAVFQQGSAEDARDAIASAREACPAWSRTPWRERVGLLRRVADLIEERIFHLGAAMALSVGKNRMESLGEVAETADLINYACDQMENNGGFVAEMGRDPIKDRVTRNVSVLRPHGVWLVISPFNFPAALTGGPAAAALIAGNTVVVKPSSDAPWTVRLLAECCRDGGLPAGVFNFVTGPGSTLGQELVSSPLVDGVTFTGSYDVGMQILRERSRLDYARPVILEMGGKNPTIVSRNADLEIAALGITRSAFGLQGQKCSACSRVYVEKPVFDRLNARLVELTEKIIAGDPVGKTVNMGPVINQTAYERYRACIGELAAAGKILTGGRVLTENGLANGWFCAPTVVVGVPEDHHLWRDEMFLPIVMVTDVENLGEAMARANDSRYGLTAGFYGTDDEANWFFDRIEAGVAYANRPVGATTGAWPGFQPFGGWKGSGSSGKNGGGLYYVQLYMRESIQSRMIR